jgi:NAD(P)-dependent dehydrogenase (short-subunit alcohol dehydrogenase family)
MISNFQNKTAVLTGAGSGFGLECARIGARLGMNLVLADVQQTQEWGRVGSFGRTHWLTGSGWWV